jgi:hypothetical protein
VADTTTLAAALAVAAADDDEDLSVPERVHKFDSDNNA